MKRRDRAQLLWTYQTLKRTKCTRDFTKEYRLYGDRFLELLEAARRKSLYASPCTVSGLTSGMLDIAKALRSHPPSGDAVKDWEASLLAATAQRRCSERSKHSIVAKANGVFIEVARARQEAFRSAVNPFKKQRSRDTLYISPAVLKLVIGCARKDALSYYNNFASPPSEYIPYLRQLRKVAHANGGFLPQVFRNHAPLAKEVRRIFLSARRREGIGSATLRRLLYPSLVDLIPFVVLLVHAFAANVDSLAHLRRNQISRYSNPLTGLRLLVTLCKPRAGGETEPYQVGIGGPLTTSWLIDAVTRLTSDVIKCAPEEHRAFLFLGVYRDKVLLMSAGNRCCAFKEWLRKNDLPEMTLNALRPTRAIADYEKHHDVDRTRALLRQKSIGTTLLYLDHTLARETDDEIIARAQTNILGLRVQPKRQTKSPSKNGASIVLPTHRCKDPHDPLVPHDENGFCVNVLWPLNDRHFVMPLEPRPVAFLLRDYHALREAQLRLPAARFSRYLPKMRYIEKHYLSMIDDDLRQAAHILISSLPTAPILD